MNVRRTFPFFAFCERLSDGFHLFYTAIKDIFGNIEAGLIQKLLKTRYGGDESKIPTADYLGPKIDASRQLDGQTLKSKHGVTTTVQELPDGGRIYTYDIAGRDEGQEQEKELPPTSEWLETLSGPGESWLRAFLTSLTVVQGQRKIDNPAQALFRPRERQKVKITVGADGQPVKAEVFGAIRRIS
jgi:fatty acid synthase subunit beta